MESLLAPEYHPMETQEQHQMEHHLDQEYLPMDHQYVPMKHILHHNYCVNSLRVFRMKKEIRQLVALNMMATVSMKQVAHTYPNQKGQSYVIFGAN